jgi:hypothetical protein
MPRVPTKHLPYMEGHYEFPKYPPSHKKKIHQRAHPEWRKFEVDYKRERARIFQNIRRFEAKLDKINDKLERELSARNTDQEKVDKYEHQIAWAAAQLRSWDRALNRIVEAHNEIHANFNENPFYY